MLSSEPLVIRNTKLGVSYRLVGHTEGRGERYATMTVLNPDGTDSDRTAMLAVDAWGSAEWEAVTLVPELARDIMPDGSFRYDSCDACNYDRHDCPGCGQPLSHNGLERTPQGWVKHEGCTD